MLAPDELGRVGSAQAESAAAAVDRLVERLAPLLAGSVRSGDLAAALADSGRVPAVVLAALGAHPLASASQAAVEAEAELSRSRRADQAAAGAAGASAAAQGGISDAAQALRSNLEAWARTANLSMAADARQTYLSVVQELVPQVASGRVGREDAVAMACRRLAERGVCVVEHGSGRRDQPDVAVRRLVQSQLSQAAVDDTEASLRRLGVRLVEVSSHSGARPSHRAMQGRVYGLDGPVTVGGATYPGLRESGAWDLLHEPNCRHSIGPYVPGRARRWAEDPDAERGLDPDEAYRATQRQRANEREVRAAKREAMACQAAGVDDTAARLRLGRAQARQRKLLSENPWMARRPERERVEGAQAVRGLASDPREAERRGAAARRAEEESRAGAEARRRIAAGELPQRVKAAKQSQHDPASPRFVPTKSELPGGEEAARALVRRYAGRGQLMAVYGRDGVLLVRERCTADGTIGTYRKLLPDGSLRETPTDTFIIHYSKAGAHVVPAKPSWEVRDAGD